MAPGGVSYTARMLRRGGLGVLVTLFVLSLPAVSHRVYASDEVQYYAFLRSVWFDHDLSFANEYQHLLDQGAAPDSGFRDTFLDGPPTATGLRPSFATIGCAVLWIPFYAVGHLMALALAWMGRPIAIDGYSWPFTLAVALGSACYGFAALLLGGEIARAVLGRRSIAAIAAMWLGTPLVFYMYIGPFFAHACEAFVVALVLWCWVRVRADWSLPGAALVGALGGLAFMVREQEALLLAVPALDAALTAWDRRDAIGSLARASKRIAALGAAMAVAAAPQIWSYLIINGRAAPNASVSRKMSWISPHALDVLFSPAHGLFAWTPLALIAVLGLILGATRRAGSSPPDRRRLAIYLLLLLALHTYVVGAVASWSLAGAFGQRRFVGATSIFVVGLTAAIESIRAWPALARRAAWVVGAACVWWNLGLVAQFSLHTMDRQRLDLVQDGRRSFVDVPVQLPAMAWRFLTDRNSFYRSSRGGE